ncbi:hypothetical protein N0V85_007990 [Neurospora sp. IMI 360204]|nr:hypothetical protein N0V85_007990 [Neurospora sp. IMI 360204]
MFESLGFLGDFNKHFTGQPVSEESKWDFASHYTGEMDAWWVEGRFWPRLNTAVLGAYDCAEVAMSAMRFIFSTLETGFLQFGTCTDFHGNVQQQQVEDQKNKYKRSVVFAITRVYALVSEMHRFLALIPAIMKEDANLEAEKCRIFGSREIRYQRVLDMRKQTEQDHPIVPAAKNEEPGFQETWEKKLESGDLDTGEPMHDSSDDEDGGAPLAIRLD